MPLNELLSRANRWSPCGENWSNRPRVIGRDIIDTAQSGRLKEHMENGGLYINPGRDVESARAASDNLASELEKLAQNSSETEYDSLRARFAADCLRRIGCCRNRIILKIINENDHIEVYIADPKRVWPVANEPLWPTEWQFYRMERYIRWENEPESAGNYWRQANRGPCLNGAWPILYTVFVGCICCTNGLSLLLFKRCWCCPPPEKCDCMDNVLRMMEIKIEPPKAKKILSVDIGLTELDLQKWDGSHAAHKVQWLLEDQGLRIQEVPGELVRMSLIEGWSLQERIEAEDVAGHIAQAIINKAMKL